MKHKTTKRNSSRTGMQLCNMNEGTSPFIHSLSSKPQRNRRTNNPRVVQELEGTSTC